MEVEVAEGLLVWSKVHKFVWFLSCRLNLLHLFCAAPTAQVSNVKVEKICSNRAALVSWTPLTLHQARGFPLYFVAYQPSSHTGRVESLVKTVSTNDSKVAIGDLDPKIEYNFTVNVATAGGKLRGTLDAGQCMLMEYRAGRPSNNSIVVVDNK